MDREEKKNLKCSRREFLLKTGVFGLGALALPVVSLCKNSFCAETAEVEEKAITPKYPWGYKKLVPADCANIAYESWYEGYCSYATVKGILGPLQKSMGEPYASLPLDAFRFGHGGVVGWGTLCGVLFGSSIAISFIAGKEGDAIINELMNWYCDTALPTYQPVIAKATIKNTTTSNSTLCHISVGKWMKKEEVGLLTPERKERCARIAADTAFKAVSLLNIWSDGKFESTRPLPIKMYNMPTQHNCVDCHGADIPSIP